MTTVKNLALTLLALASLTSWSAETTKLEDITVMALGAVDGRAVVKTTEGKMQVLKVGDTIPGTKAVVTQVLNDKLIVEDTVIGSDKKSRKQTVWVSKAAQAGDKSKVQRLEAEAPPMPPTVTSTVHLSTPAPADAQQTPPAKKKK